MSFVVLHALRTHAVCLLIVDHMFMVCC